MAFIRNCCSVTPSYVCDAEERQLDALDPTVIDRLIARELDSLMDRRLWDAAIARQESQRAVLTEVANRWIEVQAFMKGKR